MKPVGGGNRHRPASVRRAVQVGRHADSAARRSPSPPALEKPGGEPMGGWEKHRRPFQQRVRTPSAAEGVTAGPSR